MVLSGRPPLRTRPSIPMRIAFCGHSYHRTTGSSAILLDVLREQADVEVFWDEAWLTASELDLAPVVGGGFDAVVVWQVETAALRLARSRHPNVTFFPMYDGCYAKPDSFWRSLAGIKIVCFSVALHEKLQRLGLRTRFVRHYPDPDSVERVSAGPELAGFLWQRRQEVTWATVRPLLGEAAFRRFTLHAAVDPGSGDFVAPSEEDIRRYAIRTTTWFPTRGQAAADLARHNVYFAPRVREGIGLSFLEAMAMGFLVVAPDAPTMNEYIVSGVNGILYDPREPRPLDFSRFAEMGARARRCVELGRRKWCRSVPALLEFVREPTVQQPVRSSFDAFDPAAIEGEARSPPGATVRCSGAGTAARRADGVDVGDPRRSALVRDDPPAAVTVAVIAQGTRAALSRTLASAARQGVGRVELLVVALASDDGTLALLRDDHPEVDRWTSVSARDASDAMNAAAELATGRYVMFLAPGETLPTTETLSLALDGVADDADVIVGHHLGLGGGGEELHPVAAFEETWSSLRRAEIDWTWLSRVPHLPATLTLTDLLRGARFRPAMGVAAHFELLCRAARAGARFRHSAMVLARSRCAASVRERKRWFEECRQIALEYSEDPDAVARAFERMRPELRADALERLPTARLILRFATERRARELVSERMRRGIVRWRA